MSLSLAKTKLLPPKITIYADGGIGKTTFAAQSEKPIFVPTENGLAAFPNVAAYPISKEYDQFKYYLEELLTQPHDFKTVVIDSLDWLEPLIWDAICTQGKCESIDQYNGGYGAGYTEAINFWRDYLSTLDRLNEERDMAIIQIAHAQIKRYENPETQGYDRINIKLQDGKSCSAAATIFEWSDIVLYANYFVGITKEQLPGSSKKNPKERARAIGSGERILNTQERPSFKAKTRFTLPEQIPFTEDGAYWKVIRDAIPYYNQPKLKAVKGDTNNG